MTTATPLPPVRRSAAISACILTLLLCAATALPTPVPAARSLQERVQEIVGRPEFRHAHFGIEFYSPSRGEVVYQLHAEKLFVPASTTKLVSVGAALDLLGPDYRFRTPVYRTGPIAADGTLDGDLVVVAGGDPNLSGRIQPDGTLTFRDHDHAYGGPPVDGDPLLVIRELAAQVKAAGIERVNGAVVVDARLFAEGDRELGTGVVLSPMVVNDNVVDVSLAPGPEAGAPAELWRAPVTSYVRFVNRAVTVAAGEESSVDVAADDLLDDGRRVVTITGAVPLDGEPLRFVYRVPAPSRYAEVLLSEALAGVGIPTLGPAPADRALDGVDAFYRPDMLVAEHLSPPFREEAKVTLKVSQNLHASLVPLYLAPLLSPDDPERTGFDEIHDFLDGAGLDLAGARMGDGAGGDAHFSPEFMVHYLTWMAGRPEFEVFFGALPILGVDGTLADIQVDSPAAGHVHAKTGTFGVGDPLNRRLLLTAKGLAGYVDRADGERLVFAVYVNNVALERGTDIGPVVGQALGEIAAAAYDGDY